MLLVNAVHIGEEVFHDEVALWHVNEVRAVIEVLLRERGGGGEEASVASHHDADVNAFERAVVEVHAGKCLGDETRCGAEAGAVVVFLKIVVDGLGDVDGTQFVVSGLGLLIDDADGVR